MKSSFLLLLCLLSCAACVTSVPSLPEKTEEPRPDNVEQLVEQLFRRHSDESPAVRGRAVTEAPPAYAPLAEPSERLKRFCAEGNGVFSRTGGPQATAEATAMSEGAPAKDLERLRAVDRSGVFGQFVCVREDVPVWTASVEPLSYASGLSSVSHASPDGDRTGGSPDALGSLPESLGTPPAGSASCDEAKGAEPCGGGAVMRVAVTARSAPVAGF